jgi:hypothetical protein
MRKKLLALNAGLIVLLGFGIWQLRQQALAAGQRYEILTPAAEVKDVPPYPVPGRAAPVRPAEYMPVVESMLFSKDRNAIVVVEEPPPPVAVKKPPLPFLAGVMDLGGGPIAMMAPDSKRSPAPVALGEKVGEYTFVGAGLDKITLEWNGEKVELAQADLASAAAEPAPRASAGRGRAPAASAANTAAASQVGTVDPKIGTEIPGRPGVFLPGAGDNSPHGTEHNGFVKTVRRTPFGSQSWWEKKK